jgi:hypothetical protein
VMDSLVRLAHQHPAQGHQSSQTQTHAEKSRSNSIHRLTPKSREMHKDDAARFPIRKNVPNDLHSIHRIKYPESSIDGSNDET